MRRPQDNGYWSRSIPRTYHPSEGAWKPGEMDRFKLEGASAVSPFSPYLGEGTVLQRDISAMPIAEDSAAHAKWMWDNGTLVSSTRTGLNSSAFGTRPIPIYVVDSADPTCGFQYMDDARGAGQQHEQMYLEGPIPWPSWAKPASNQDMSIAIYDTATGIMREFFMVRPVSGKPGHWISQSAGYSIARPGLTGLSETNYPLSLDTGTSAAVGMHNPLGFIGVAEARMGRIDHAVCFTTSQMRKGCSWPAVSGDGTSDDPNAPVEGQWCRLPKWVDPRDYHPFTGLIIRAFQEYGGLATDKNLYCHAFNLENCQTEIHLTGVDPWVSEIPSLYEGSLDVNGFPWHLTEWAPIDWGRPSIDWKLRPGHGWPIVR
ncbi:hypothetical protein [Janibacter massiliensis]|uniref:hypothetical protein n=1 Tax=Janibacter massiliensis TaxID=2058291 RepID=UPI0018FE4535|nr:hypothetical protein [Janibacter massiliensis]